MPSRQWHPAIRPVLSGIPLLIAAVGLLLPSAVGLLLITAVGLLLSAAVGHRWGSVTGGPHLDVTENEISLTTQIRLEPRGWQWPLVVQTLDGKQKAVSMDDNEGVLYRSHHPRPI